MAVVDAGAAPQPYPDGAAGGLAWRACVSCRPRLGFLRRDLLFCRLMLPHHLGGLHMIDEVIARGSRPEVIALAEQMRADQQREINQLHQLLAPLERGRKRPAQ
jgi:hypothetical protein